MRPGNRVFDADSWCGTCRPATRTVYGERCEQCHPEELRGRVPARHCGMCARDTRLLSDNTRCPDCHPFADYAIDRYAARPWCKQCDESDRYVYMDGFRYKCPRCHRLGRKPMVWPTFDIPDGFTEQFLACDWLCFISPTLRRVGPDRLRLYLRRWFEAGYTPKDIVYNLDHLPTGELYETRTPAPSEDPRVIENWLKRRLREWLDSEEDPLPPVNSHIRYRRDMMIAEQGRRRREQEQVRAAAADPRLSPGAAQARTIARIAATMSRHNRAEAGRREREKFQRQREMDQAQRTAYHEQLRRLSAERESN